MIVLTWNVAHGTGTTAALALANTLDADIVLLQEASLKELGQDNVCCRAVPSYDWGSAVLARHGTLVPVPIDGFDGWVVGAR